MFLLRARTLFSVSLACLLLVSCAQQPLSSVDRTKYRTVAVNPSIKDPERYVYRDITGKRARGIGANAGLIWVLVGGMIGAGFRRPWIQALRPGRV